MKNDLQIPLALSLHSQWNLQIFQRLLAFKIYRKNYDFVLLPLPSRYGFWLALPIIVTLSSLTVPHRFLKDGEGNREGW
jgi:cellulose biosynthesis protein BcsQ